MPIPVSRRTMLKTVLSATAVAFVMPHEIARADQPHMEAALDALQKAKRALDNATEDKGGFRLRALRNVEQAIVQVQRGIEWDKNHQNKEERGKHPRGGGRRNRG